MSRLFRRLSARFARGLVAALTGVSLNAAAQVASPSIEWSSIDGGGALVSQGGDWTLSGTIGQADATSSSALVGGAWNVSGGFWSLIAGRSDLLFLDGFESGGTPRSQSGGGEEVQSAGRGVN